MNLGKITFKTLKGEYSIPNRWELLTPDQFLHLCALITQHAAGSATANDVRLFYVCNSLGVNPGKIKDTETMENLMVLADQIDFIFDKSGKINISFIAQLVPELKTKKIKFKGYEINTSFDTLTCSLTASQFIEAQEVLRAKAEKLPLLAAILYCPTPYSSQTAHGIASDFVNVNPLVLQSIALNFQAFVTFIFTRTHFSLLSAGNKKDIPEIATGLAETLFNLSADGMGDINTVKQMPVIEFLTILRKKLIESVRAMHDAKIDLLEISSKTGLSTKTIKKML